MMQIYGLKNCDTCRKALTALRAAGHPVEFIDARADGIAPERLAVFLETFGEALVNRRSTTWRGLSGEDRTGDPAVLLQFYPALMKRPVIQTDSALFLGWGRDVQDALLP